MMFWFPTMPLCFVAWVTNFKLSVDYLFSSGIWWTMVIKNKKGSLVSGSPDHIFQSLHLDSLLGVGAKLFCMEHSH